MDDNGDLDKTLTLMVGLINEGCGDVVNASTAYCCGSNSSDEVAIINIDFLNHVDVDVDVVVVDLFTFCRRGFIFC